MTEKQASINSLDYADLPSSKQLANRVHTIRLGIIRRSA
jgi:hypothetical protein